METRFRPHFVKKEFDWVSFLLYIYKIKEKKKKRTHRPERCGAFHERKRKKKKRKKKKSVGDSQVNEFDGPALLSLSLSLYLSHAMLVFFSSALVGAVADWRPGGPVRQSLHGPTQHDMIYHVSYLSISTPGNHVDCLPVGPSHLLRLSSFTYCLPPLYHIHSYLLFIYFFLLDTSLFSLRLLINTYLVFF